MEVVSGPIYYSQKPYKNPEGKAIKNTYSNESQMVLLKNGLIVPPKFYKIIKCNTKDSSYSSGFTFENKKVDTSGMTHKDFEEKL